MNTVWIRGAGGAGVMHSHFVSTVFLDNGKVKLVMSSKVPRAMPTIPVFI